MYHPRLIINEKGDNHYILKCVFWLYYIMFQNVIEFLNNNLWVKILIESYLIFIVISLILFLVINTKRAIYMLISTFMIFVIYYLTKSFELKIVSNIYLFLGITSVIFTFVVFADDFKKTLLSRESKNKDKLGISESVVHELSEAIKELSDTHTGALITFEMNNALDEYVTDIGVRLNSDISKKLLLNIFTVGTALHDGAVIIRKDKILYAAAYYNLSGSEEDKSVGARHRAAKSISEKTDSYTIVVSEETGKISLAFNGNLHVQQKSNIENLISSFYVKEN